MGQAKVWRVLNEREVKLIVRSHTRFRAREYSGGNLLRKNQWREETQLGEIHRREVGMGPELGRGEERREQTEEFF